MLQSVQLKSCDVLPTKLSKSKQSPKHNKHNKYWFWLKFYYITQIQIQNAYEWWRSQANIAQLIVIGEQKENHKKNRATGARLSWIIREGQQGHIWRGLIVGWTGSWSIWGCARSRKQECRDFDQKSKTEVLGFGLGRTVSTGSGKWWGEVLW